MIIDTTVSAMEKQMNNYSRSNAHVQRKFSKNPVFGWPVDRQAKAQYRESAIRDFLIKQGQEQLASKALGIPVQSLNYIAFWENGEVINVRLLAEPSAEEIECAKIAKEKEHEAHLEKLLAKFSNFMRYRTITVSDLIHLHKISKSEKERQEYQDVVATE